MPRGGSWGNVVVVGSVSVMLAVVVAWGPVASELVSEPASAPAPTRTPVFASPAPPPAPSPPPPPARAFLPPLIVRGPVDAQAKPALIAAPGRPKRVRPPLYKQWLFWVVTGGLLASTVAATIIVTRPHQQPYTSDVFPYVVTFP